MTSSSSKNPFTVRPLDEKSLKVAQKELNEDPKRRNGDCEALRVWIRQQPYLKSIETDEFLLRFLRQSKYSILNSQERLENFWANRSELPQWFRNIDLSDPLMQEIIDLCYSIPLPQETEDRSRVLLVRTGCWSTTKYELDDIMKYAFAVTDVLNTDPRVQIDGWIGVVDLANISSGHIQQMTPGFIKNAVRCWQDTYPARIKAIHFINYPKIFDVPLSIIKMCLKEKTKQRLVFHGNDLKSLQKHLSKKVLPAQYGGTAGDLFELNELWREELSNNQNYLNEMQKCGVDFRLRDQYKKIANSERKTGETTGVFRKLNND